MTPDDVAPQLDGGIVLVDRIGEGRGGLVEQIGPWSVSRVIPGKPLAEHAR